MHEIEIWLKSKGDFAEGRLLYSKYGQFKSVEKILFESTENKMTRELLEDQLKKALANCKNTIVIKPKPAVNTKPVTIAKQEPSNYQLAANAIYAQMGAIQARLSTYSTDAERAKAYHNLIHELQPAWAEAQYKADYFNEHGELPKEPLKPAKKVTRVNELTGPDYKKLTLLRSKVSRAKNEQIPKYKADPKYADKLAKRLAEVAEWEKQILQLESGAND